MGRSWEAMITRRVASQRTGYQTVDGRVVAVERYTKGDEELGVTYVPTPTGAEVSEVAYQIRDAAISEEAFQASVVQRYGRPAHSEDVVSLYCSPGERYCSFAGSARPSELPTIIASNGWQGRRLVLHQGNRVMTAYEAMVSAEVARRAPQVRRPTF
jgi:hypothetical protein